ncbi:MAG: hypothetical protein H6Q90_5214 [Deltaproteobacteria bacterium]|nr:hypothetical protein [Deltaproteobacteria bacterium]
MRTLTKVLLLSTLTAACATETEPAQPNPILPPGGGVRPGHSVPGGDQAISLLFGPGSSFVPAGPTAPGTASFVAAPVTEDDPNGPNPGTGGMNITIGSELFSSTTLQTVSVSLTDENANAYLALAGFSERPGPGATSIVDEVIVIVPASDFAPGATIALDGNERVALFASGPSDADQPSLYGAALTGSVTFTSGSMTVGDTITANVAGDFGAIEFLPGGGGGGGGGTITDGAYTLTVFGPSEVHCEGTLVGQEAAFASISALDLGLTGGAVTLANGTNLVTIAGAPIASGFGAASLDLDSMDGLYAGFTNENAPGPAGTTFVGKYLVLDSESATPTLINAGVGAGYSTATDDGQCTVALGASLTAP